MIKHKINQLRHKITEDNLNNTLICIFNNTNISDNPNIGTTSPNIFTSYNKLKLIFKKLNNKRSSCYDNIPNISLKNLPPLYICHNTILFNNCPNSYYFSSKWKIAKVIALKKKKGKDDTNPNNYRPINFLPNISKIFGTLINGSINSFCTDNSIIPETRFGSNTNIQQSTQLQNLHPI